MAPRIILSAEARADLNSLKSYVADQDGQLRSEMAIGRIEETIRMLAFMPGMGRTRADLVRNARAFPSPPWIIIYRPLAEFDGIQVLRVLEGRRGLTTIFGK
jgi:plasmid stabilization system protein ParE